MNDFIHMSYIVRCILYSNKIWIFTSMYKMFNAIVKGKLNVKMQVLINISFIHRHRPFIYFLRFILRGRDI